MSDRRYADNQADVKGGRRWTDPPLSTRDCADWMGMAPDYILDAIKAGRLKAERFGEPGARPSYRVHLEDFIAFLQRIGFRRLPKRGAM